MDIDPEDIKARHRILYDSWDPESRERILNLEELPLFDEQDTEIRIYDSDGRKIARRSARISDLSYGHLVNLRTVTALFQSNDEMDIDDDLYEEDENTTQLSKQNKVSLSIYPQAFLHDYGHIQAKGPFYLMQPTIERVNSHFQQLFDEMDDDHKNNLAPNTNLITAISTQMYNEFMHRAATQAGALDVVRGRMSSTLAAPPNKRATQNNSRMGDVLKRYCNLALPHTRFVERTQVPNCPTALRVESVYNIDLKCIPEPQRNGRFVKFILSDLLTYLD